MSRACQRAPRGQRGVALLTVLLLVAVMTLLIIGMLDDIRFATRRTRNTQAVTQAQWHALGAEAIARREIARLGAASPGIDSLDSGWNGRDLTVPIEQGEGGVLRLRINDAATCFNLNSVVEGAAGQWRRRELGVRQYRALMIALDFTEAESLQLSDTLVDWIDDDGVPSSSGAEDPHYAHLRPPRRTAGTLLAEASELRAISDYAPATYARLRPFVCALPDAGLSPININMLAASDAPLLSMLSMGALDRAGARQVIASRPPGGWRDQATFWSLPLLAGAALPNPVLEQTELKTRFFALHAEVEYGDAQVVLSELLERRDRDLVLRARRWTPDE